MTDRRCGLARVLKHTILLDNGYMYIPITSTFDCLKVRKEKNKQYYTGTPVFLFRLVILVFVSQVDNDGFPRLELEALPNQLLLFPMFHYNSIKS